MPTRHTISRADQLFRGSSYYPRANTLPGVIIDFLNYISFGAIATAAANAIALSQASAGGNNALTLNGALASAGVASIPTPRNVVAAWTGAAIITVTGTDQYGQAMSEQSGSGTAFTGKKAFATVTAVTFNAAVTAATVGTGVQIGLPYRCDANGLVIAKQNNATDAATLTVADTTSPATTTTGDVRGTVSFAAAPNGAIVFAVWMKIADTTATTLDRKTGTYGVDNV